MSIEIKGYTQRIPAEAGRSATTSPGSTAGRQPAATAPHTDRVTLSEAAQRMGNVEDSQSTIPVFDYQRVASLKKAIHEHSYNIDPERVAEKLQHFGKALQGSK